MYVRKDCSVNISVVLYYTPKQHVRTHTYRYMHLCVGGWVGGCVRGCVGAYACVRAKTGWGIAHPNSMYVRKYCSVRISTCAYTYTKIHASIYGCHMHVCVCVCVCVSSMNECIHTHTHTHTHTWILCTHLFIDAMYTHTHTHTNIHTCIYGKPSTLNPKPQTLNQKQINLNRKL